MQNPERRAKGLAALHGAWFWPCAFLILVALRLPYITSPNFFVDGDESMMGLMAKHLSEGREFSVFPYGVAYGFALLETIPAAVGFRLFGPEPTALIGSMLALFLVGLVFYEKAFYALTCDREWSRGLMLILGLLPVWIVWSMKARGGYLPAFFLFGVVLWLTTRESLGTKGVVVGGMLVGLLAHSQAFWFLGMLPLLLLPVTSGKSARHLLPALASAAAVYAGLYLMGSGSDAYWKPTVFAGWHPARVASLPVYLHQLFSGFFYLREIRTPPLLVSGVAWLLTAGYFSSLVLLGKGFAQRRESRSGLMALALLFAVAMLPFLNTVPPRYLLQVSVLLVVAQAFWLGRRASSSRWLLRLGGGGLLVLLCLSAFQMTELRPINPETDSNFQEELYSLLDFLDVNEVEGVYSVNGLLTWQLMFYGQERIPARFSSAIDRYPPYPAKVDSILDAGGRTALLAPIDAADLFSNTYLEDDLIRVGLDYLVLLDPSRRLLEGGGFEFKR
jgi:hypothetical protein